LLATSGCPLCSEPFYEIVAPEPVVRLPLDESTHCFGGAEWWYYTGRLGATDGRFFGVQAVVFHVPRSPYGVLAEFWVAHVAVLDIQTGEFVYDQVRRPGSQMTGPAPGQGFRLRTPLVSAEGFDGHDRLEARIGDGSYELAVTLHDTRDPVLHGGDGYVPYGTDGMSFYYSRPRMEATGTLTVGGQPLTVDGELWFDRQWGLDLRNPLQPWDWFSIRLDDGTDIMLFRFPAEGGPVALGTLVPGAGQPRQLAAGEFAVTSTATWTSPRTGVEYDVAWDIAIPACDLLLSVTAVAANQEFDARSSTFNVYWEGLCGVAGSSQGTEIGGYAYVEQANGGS
jgi:predicted secreted hydrolase